MLQSWKRWCFLAVGSAAAAALVPVASRIIEDHVAGDIRRPDRNLSIALTLFAGAVLVTPLAARGAARVWGDSHPHRALWLAAFTPVALLSIACAFIWDRRTVSDLLLPWPALSIAGAGFGLAFVGRRLWSSLFRLAVFALVTGLLVLGGLVAQDRHGLLNLYREDVRWLQWQIPFALAFGTAASALAAARRLRGEKPRSRLFAAAPGTLAILALLPSYSVPRRWQRSDIGLVIAAHLLPDGDLILVGTRSNPRSRSPLSPFAVLRCNRGSETCTSLTRRPVPPEIINQADPVTFSSDSARVLTVEKAAPWQWALGIDAVMRIRSTSDGTITSSFRKQLTENEYWQAFQFGPGRSWAVARREALELVTEGGARRRFRLPFYARLWSGADRLRILDAPCGRSNSSRVVLREINWSSGQSRESLLPIDGSPCDLWIVGAGAVVSTKPAGGDSVRCMYSMADNGNTHLLGSPLGPDAEEPFLSANGNSGPRLVRLDRLSPLLALLSHLEPRNWWAPSRQIHDVGGVKLIAAFGLGFHGATPSAIIRLDGDPPTADLVARPFLTVQWTAESVVFLEWDRHAERVLRYFPRADRLEVLWVIPAARREE